MSALQVEAVRDECIIVRAESLEARLVHLAPPQVCRTYLEWLTALPWGKFSEEGLRQKPIPRG